MLGGALLAIQSRMLGVITRYVGDPLVAGYIAMTTAFAVTVMVLLAWPSARTALRRVMRSISVGRGGQHRATALPRLRWWMCVGGASGAFFVVTQSMAVGVLGVALLMVAAVAGQSTGGLLVDRSGIAPGGARPITATTVIGPVLAVTAAVISVAGSAAVHPATVGFAVLPFVAGGLQSWQQAMNGRVREVACGADQRSVLPGTVATLTANFAVGLFTLTIALLVASAVRGVGVQVEAWPSNPWLLSAGTFAIGFTGIAAVVVRRIGVLLLGLGMIAGQMAGALVLDLTAGNPVRGTTLIAVALTVAAVAVPGIAARTPSPTRRPPR